MNRNRLFLGAVFFLAICGPAAAADSPDALLRALAECATVADEQARLACYDELAPYVKAALASPAPPAVASVPPPGAVAPAAPPAAAPSTPPSTAVASAPPAAAAPHTPTEEEQKSHFGFNVGDLFGSSPEKQTTPEQFGSERTEAKQQEIATKEIDSITAGVAEYAYNPFGKFIVILDNGQIWKQLQGDSDRARFKRKASDNTVRISRGLIASYNLQINGSEAIFKVTRIK